MNREARTPKVMFDRMRNLLFSSMHAGVYLKFDEFSLNFSQRNALLIIDKKGESTPGELSKILHQKVPSVARLIRSLERRGYITIVCGTEDRRQRILKLTARGTELVKKLDKLPIRRITEMISLLSAKEQDRLWQGLDVMETGLQRLGLK